MKLTEYTEYEWRAVTRQLMPEWTEEQIEDAWKRFQEFKETISDVEGSA